MEEQTPPADNIITLDPKLQPNGKIRIMLDASAAKEAGCLRRLEYNIIHGYRSDIVSNDIIYGSAFHMFIKTMKESGGLDFSAATQAALKTLATPCYQKPKKLWCSDPRHLIAVCMTYWNKYYGPEINTSKDFNTCKDEQGKPLVELKFAVPYYVDDSVEVMLCGTIDDICYQQGGCYAIRDYKTTSVWDSEGYLSAYALNPQLMFYRFVLQIYAQLRPDSIFGEINKKPVGCFIDGVFLNADALKTTFKRSEVFFYKQDQMDEFVRGINELVAIIVEIVKGNFKTIRNGMISGGCETVYGKCKYFNVCAATDDVARGHILKRQFIQRPYNPLEFN